ncbi:MAG: helix-turn-helix domain-containing protein [Planctomycetota bacterium]
MTDEQAKQILAANIRRLLEERKISGRQLAKLTGDNPVTINRLLRGDHVPGIGLVTRIAASLRTSVDYLLKIHEEAAVSA